MNRTLAFATVLAASLSTVTLTAQAPAAAAQAAAPAAAPQAIPAKIAIVEFEQVVLLTNEAQHAMADINKKYEPQQAKIQAAQTEIEGLRKQLQALPATTSDEERANRLKVIDAKEKQANLDIETAQGAYQDEENKAIGPIYNKVGLAAMKYAQDNGFTLLLNNPGPQQQGPMTLIWANPSTDISQAVLTAYNASSGVAAPPAAPSAAKRPTTPAAPAPTKKP